MRNHQDSQQKTDTQKAVVGKRTSVGPVEFHRRSSWIPLDAKERRFKWLVYDNNGSYNGWFDWLPLWMRVGYWSPVTVVFLMLFYTSMYVYRPRPLSFDTTATNHDWIDSAIFLWGVFVVVHARVTMGSIAGFFVSYTGWSWMILTARAGLEAASQVLEPTLPDLAHHLAILGSSLRFPAAVAAFITFVIWNFLLFPLLCFFAMPPGKKRDGFVKFNFSFFMVNVHMLNLPMAIMNNVYGSSARLFTRSDLYVAYLIVAIYSATYLFILDRLGVHLYPIFCPRTAASVLSFATVLALYYFAMIKGNELILYLNPHVSIAE